MADKDVYRLITEQDEETLQNLISRMEFRGKDPVFSEFRDAYLERLPLPSCERVLEIGCGTGVVARALARRPEFSGRVMGADPSPAFIEAAGRLAAEEGLSGRCEFRVGDGRTLDLADESFDAVILHTVISHVADPLDVLREAGRVLRPGGTAAVFDGDYTSLTFGCGDAVLGKAMEEALRATVYTIPGVMRELPRMLPRAGLELREALPRVFAEVGSGSFFPNFALTYGPRVAEAGLIPPERVEAWLAELRRTQEEGTFFAACNYYAYLAERPRAE